MDSCDVRYVIDKRRRLFNHLRRGDSGRVGFRGERRFGRRRVAPGLDDRADGRDPLFELRRGRHVRTIAREHRFERHLRVRGRLERGAHVELQRAPQPVCKRRRQRRQLTVAVLAQRLRRAPAAATGYSSGARTRPSSSDSATTPIALASARWFDRGSPADGGIATRSSRHNLSRPRFSFSSAGPNACSAITSRACGVTISRSTASAPIAASRLCRPYSATAGKQLTQQGDHDGDVDRQRPRRSTPSAFPTAASPASNRKRARADRPTADRGAAGGRTRRGGRPRSARRARPAR